MSILQPITEWGSFHFGVVLIYQLLLLCKQNEIHFVVGKGRRLSFSFQNQNSFESAKIKIDVTKLFGEIYYLGLNRLTKM